MGWRFVWVFERVNGGRKTGKEVKAGGGRAGRGMMEVDGLFEAEGR